MALVRVYCGLSSKQPSGSPAGTDEVARLTAAVVDDSGRLLQVRDVADSAAGYAELGVVLADRSGGVDVAVAADSDEHQVTLLLAAAGRPLAIVDEESLDDYADRFGDDDSPDELEAPGEVRRAIGLARALQAGALAASVQSAPRELTALKPVLAAHAAVASGRQAAAVALREVLRELYPAALRAYPDPCEPVPLAILDALPEPGLLGSGSRSRDEAVAAELITAGVGDSQHISDAITALRLAITETPRRTGIGKSLTTAIADTIRQSVAAVRACDTAAGALVGVLAEKVVPVDGRRAAQQPVRPVREPEPAVEPARSAPRRTRTAIPPSTRGAAPVSASAAVPPPAVPPMVAASTTLASSATLPTSAPPGPAHRQPDHLAAPAHGHAVADELVERSRGTAQVPPPLDRRRPTSPVSSAYASVPIPSPRPAPEVPPPTAREDWPLTNSEYLPTRAAAEEPALARNPLDGSGYALTSFPPTVLEPPSRPATAAEDRPAPRQAPGPGIGRVAPPWQDEALSGEPPTLNMNGAGTLGDYSLLATPDPLLGMGGDELRFDTPYDPPPLRLVEPDSGRIDGRQTGEPMGGPVNEENDGDLLIFAETRSAWFTGHLETEDDTSLDWHNAADLGWEAAERAAEPILGEATMAGLPRRVPQANLVPGSALPPATDRSLRIVRDPAAMAAHTTGYFRGSRRGEEVRGFAVGGRPGRESAGGWDFTRDSWEGDRDEGYEYRSAAHK